MSRRTTDFGPRVSFATNLADPGPVHVFLDSNSTLEVDGQIKADGQMAFGSTSTTTFAGHNVFSKTVAVNSGSTTTLAGHVVATGTVNSSSTNTFSGYNVFSGTVNAVSGSTVTLAGRVNSISTLDVSNLAARLMSKQTTASYTSLTLADGEFTIGTVSVTSARLVFRSGVTTYEWWADRATLL